MTDICRVMRYDVRGHGRSGGSSSSADYRWDHLASDLLELGDHLQLPGLVAGGVSMGAAVALWAACLAPTRIEALILGAPPPAWEFRTGVKDRYEASAHIVEKYGLAELNRRTAKLPPPDIFKAHPERVHARISVDEKYLPAVMRGAAESDLPGLRQLTALRQATLILAWANDSGHPVAIAERLAAAMPVATLNVANDLDGILQWPSVVREFIAGL